MLEAKTAGDVVGVGHDRLKAMKSQGVKIAVIIS